MEVAPTRLLLILMFCLNCRSASSDYDDGNFGASLGDAITQSVQRSLKPLENLGPAISQRVQQATAPLENLGEAIQQQVHQSLKPVRVMQSILRVKTGGDGTTIVTFQPSGKEFIIRNNVLYTCAGTISYSNGQCSGHLQSVNFQEKKDFCFTNVNARINNWCCISPSGGVNVGAVNGRVYCSSSDGSPTLLISADEYKSLCQDVASSATYKFFTNNNIEEIGNGLRCSGRGPQVCTWSTSLGYDPDTNLIGGSGNIIYS